MGLELDAIKEIEELKSEIAADGAAAEDRSNAVESVGISLLDLAEILDQHKIWVEIGRRIRRQSGSLRCKFREWADLTGVNLAGSSPPSHEFGGCRFVHGKFARCQPGAFESTECKFVRHGIARRQPDGRQFIWC